MTLLWHILKWQLIVFLFFIAVLLLFVSSVALTPNGAQWVIESVFSLFSEHITVERIDASSLFDVTLYQVRSRSPKGNVQIDVASLRWVPKWSKRDHKLSVEIQKAFVRSNQLALTVRGKISEVWNIQWSIDQFDLVHVNSEWKGKITADGHITGDFFSPQVKLNGSVPELQLGDSIYLRQLRFDGIVRKMDSGFRAKAVFKPAQLLIPKFGVDVHLDRSEIQEISSKKMHFFSVGRAGKGTVKLDGTLDLANDKPHVEAMLTGDHALLLNTLQYHVQCSPRLKLTIRNGEGFLTGTLLIPEARFAPRAFKMVNVLPDEVEWVDASRPEFRTPRLSAIDDLNVHVNIVLGDRVQLEDSDLKAKLAGTVMLLKGKGNFWRGNGVVELKDGGYEAYGSLLTFERGRLIYAGNAMDNPALDILAVKHVERISKTPTSLFNASNQAANFGGSEQLTVGVTLRGFLQKPVVKLYSNPSGLTQAEILSYLAVGQSSIGGVGDAGGALWGTLKSFFPKQNEAGKTGDPLKALLGGGDISFGSREYLSPGQNSTVNAASLNIAKTLSPRLSLHYSVGLFVPVSVFQLRYKLSEHFSLQTESSALENGLDVFYQYEK